MHELEARPAADHDEAGFGDGGRAGNPRADELVEGVVAPHVLAVQQERSTLIEKRRPVRSPRVPEPDLRCFERSESMANGVRLENAALRANH